MSGLGVAKRSTNSKPFSPLHSLLAYLYTYHGSNPVNVALYSFVCRVQLHNVELHWYSRLGRYSVGCRYWYVFIPVGHSVKFSYLLNIYFKSNIASIWIYSICKYLFTSESKYNFQERIILFYHRNRNKK